VLQLTCFKNFSFPELSIGRMERLFWSEVPAYCDTRLSFLCPVPNVSSVKKLDFREKAGLNVSSETHTLNTWPTTGLLGLSGLLKWTQSASFTLQPLYHTSSTNVRSFDETLYVVTPAASGSSTVVDSGRAYPGPARTLAKLVVDEYGGPMGGDGDVSAW
jgi:hypothetical protein